MKRKEINEIDENLTIVRAGNHFTYIIREKNKGKNCHRIVNIYSTDDEFDSAEWIDERRYSEEIAKDILEINTDWEKKYKETEGFTSEEKNK